MARRLPSCVALLSLAILSVPAAAKAVSVDNGGRADRTVQAVQTGTAAACRTPLRSVSDSASEQCSPIDGRTISEAQVAAYEQSWTHRALSLQRGLDDAAPLVEEQLSHTHNSFNASSYSLRSTSYYPTLTNQDPNQVYSLTDQLRMDVRAVEIDLHWMPSPYAVTNGRTDTGGKWVTMCHGDNGLVTGVHVGCSWDRPFEDGLTEVRAWLDANPGQVILLYLENQLTDESGGYNPQAHDIAASIINEKLGTKVYRPKARSCDVMPMDTVSAADIRAAGAQVLIVGNCGAGGAWGTWVHERGPRWDEHGNPATYDDAACIADRTARQNDATFRRYFEDSTWLAAMQNGKNSLTTPPIVAHMVQCGVNIIGLDQLTPQDPRLPALVWSWAQNEPATDAGNCAFSASDGRFHAGDCKDRHGAACVDANGAWHVTAATKWDKARAACSRAFPGSRFAVPANDFRNQLLVEAKGPSSSDVWLNYANVNGTWTPSLAS